MASVHLARRVGSEGDSGLVAVKVLHGHLQDDEEHRVLFRREADLIAHIRHPNVASLIEFGEEAGEPYLVMEYVEGSTLGTLQAHTARTGSWLSRSAALTICIDALAGLHSAHTLKDAAGNSAGIVHRDVSPQNILVGVSGQAKVVDFGIAHASDLDSKDNDSVRGRLAYMSPEHMRGEDIDRRADVYALGIVLWELLTAKRLFKHRHDGAQIDVIEAVPRVRSIKSDLPQDLDECVARALAPRREDRFDTCEAFADALEAAVEKAGLELSRKEVSELVLGASGRELELRRASARAAATAESGPQWSAPSDPAPQPVGSSASRLPLPRGNFSTPGSEAMSQTPPPVAVDLPRASHPSIHPSYVGPPPGGSVPPPMLSDMSRASYVPGAIPGGQHSVPPQTTSRAWQWVLVLGLAALVGTLLVVAWQRAHPPETTVISPNANAETPEKKPQSSEKARLTPDPTSKPGDGALSVDDIPVWQSRPRTASERAKAQSGSSDPTPAATTESKPSEPTPPKKRPSDVDLANPYR
ncbi:MAG: protein kinase [Polyangiaceae bacterium]|nr:protein kinase [Polyangiaceae bacterium]MCB9607774.1 protein kinase [Polyangiaceae bacterium]